MLTNRKETFELLEELFGEGGDRIIIELTANTREQMNWIAGVALTHLNDLEDDRQYVEYCEGLHRNVFMYSYELEDDPDSLLSFSLMLEKQVCTKPYYNLYIGIEDETTPEENVLHYHVILRKNGNDGRWQPKEMDYSYLESGRGKCATCPRLAICLYTAQLEEENNVK